jgi:DNA-binding MurR/RpiR family transcriptional regulator
MAIREQVQTALGTLPGAEKKIAHAFLANYPSIGLSTIAELAALAGTSAPTVLRFVARLGFESYPEFQRVLRNDVQAQLMSPLERARTTGPDIDNPALKASFASVTANLAATLRAVPESEFEAACDLLSDHKSACYLLGAGSPTPSPPTWLRTCRSSVRMSGILMDRRRHGATSCSMSALAMSPSCSISAVTSPTWSGLGELLVERKARILLITDPWLSPIARSARVVLPCVVDANRTWDSSITLMAVAEALIDRVSRAQSEAARARMQALEDIHWNNLPGR